MKKAATGFGILILVGILALPVFAQGPFGGGKGYSGHADSRRQAGGGYADLSEEQRKELDKLDREFFNETGELRRQIWSKSDELEVVLNTSEPDVTKAKALLKEVSELKGKMAERRLDLDLKARKIAPEMEFGRGRGKGLGRHMMRGDGPRWGAGQGPGACWD